MDNADVAFAGIADQAGMLRDRVISSTELTELYLGRIRSIDPSLNAFADVFADEAKASAVEADRRIAAGESAPLLGVPIAIKDELDIAGQVARHGTVAYETPADADSEHVRRLRAAGGIVIGKTRLPELAITGFTESEFNGDTRNPWDVIRTPGGSSGGSAAAVAAGLVGAASASDGAGSIRIPAANCGLFGLKPQRGRISFMPEREHWYGLSKTGCLTRKVIDTALWLDVAAGPAPGDVHTPPPPDGTYVDAARRDPGRLRVAFSTSPVRALAPPIVDPVVVSVVHDVASVLEGSGHSVTEQTPDYGSVGNEIAPIYLRGIRQHYEQVPHPERLEPRTRGFARLGGLVPDRFLYGALRRMPEHEARINRIFEDVDVLITPVTGEPPVPVGKWAGQGAVRTAIGMSRSYPFTVVWNYTGQPAASIPAGLTEDGLPLGVMLIVAPNREELLLSVAAQLEGALAWPDRTPPIG